MKRTANTSQHPVLRTVLAASLTMPLGAAVAVVPAQPAYASYYNKTLCAGETFKHTVNSKQPDILDINVRREGYVRLKITVSNDAKDSLSGINFEPFINDVSEYNSVLRAGDDTTTKAIPVGPDKHLKVKVDTFGFCSKMPYTIHVIAFTPNGLETEPNDTLREANRLTWKSPRYGLLDVGEKDFYSTTATEEGLYDFKLKLSSDANSTAYIKPCIKIDENTLEKLDSFDSKRLTTICTKSLRKGQKAVVALESPFSSSSASQCFYQIKLTRREVPVPQLKSLSAKRRALTASWSRTSKHANGYQIRWSTSKSMKNAGKKLVSGAKRTSTKLEGLKPKKRYYVQVRAYYVDYDRETGWHRQHHFFSWSKAKSAKTK